MTNINNGIICTKIQHSQAIICTISSQIYTLYANSGTEIGIARCTKFSRDYPPPQYRQVIKQPKYNALIMCNEVTEKLTSSLAGPAKMTILDTHTLRSDDGSAEQALL